MVLYSIWFLLFLRLLLVSSLSDVFNFHPPIVFSIECFHFELSNTYGKQMIRGSPWNFLAPNLGEVEGYKLWWLMLAITGNKLSSIHSETIVLFECGLRVYFELPQFCWLVYMQFINSFIQTSWPSMRVSFAVIVLWPSGIRMSQMSTDLDGLLMVLTTIQLSKGKES